MSKGDQNQDHPIQNRRQKIPRCAKLYFPICPYGFLGNMFVPVIGAPLMNDVHHGMTMFSNSRQLLGTWLDQTNWTSWDEAYKRFEVDFCLQNIAVELEFTFRFPLSCFDAAFSFCVCGSFLGVCNWSQTLSAPLWTLAFSLWYPAKKPIWTW